MRKYLILGAFLAGLSVVLGAFGAHALREQLSSEQLNSFEVAVRYQMYHSLAILIVNSYASFSRKHKKLISLFFFIGILCFSGSIYLITAGVSASYIWFITPLGGLFFIIGWMYSVVVFAKR